MFAFWCFASASCKQRQRTGCYRILEAKVKGEVEICMANWQWQPPVILSTALHCTCCQVALWWKQEDGIADSLLLAEDAPSPASASQADLCVQLKMHGKGAWTEIAVSDTYRLWGCFDLHCVMIHSSLWIMQGPGLTTELPWERWWRALSEEIVCCIG